MTAHFQVRTFEVRTLFQVVYNSNKSSNILVHKALSVASIRFALFTIRPLVALKMLLVHHWFRWIDIPCYYMDFWEYKSTAILITVCKPTHLKTKVWGRAHIADTNHARPIMIRPRFFIPIFPFLRRDAIGLAIARHLSRLRLTKVIDDR